MLFQINILCLNITDLLVKCLFRTVLFYYLDTLTHKLSKKINCIIIKTGFLDVQKRAKKVSKAGF
jgi:hypothetical protein